MARAPASAKLLLLFFAVYNVEADPIIEDLSQLNETSLQTNELGEERLQYFQPRHVHISYGNSPTEMFITWSTLSDPGASIVEFGKNRLSEFRVNGSTTSFTDSGPSKLTQFIHRVTLDNLEPNQQYMYHVGSELGWSEIFFFRVMPNDTNWLPQVAIFGDLGSENAQSLTRLQEEVQLGQYDAIIHVGDFAYDMNSNNGLTGDAFMSQIQPIAGYVPYMTCPGNHESADNFAHYKNRFTMPGNTESMYFSFNMGPIHFISFSTEFYYFLNYGMNPLINQYYWLENDLKEATKPENRAIRPWIVTFGHRPMYCSNNNTDDCTRHETRVRVGVPFLHWFGLEDMFMQYGVDLTIWAHEHSYERMLPLYNRTVYNGTQEEPYRNPKGLVHVTTGSAGCKERHDEFLDYIPRWTAFRSTDYGYSRLKVINSTHLYMEQVSDDQDGKVIDSFTLIRDRHEPYPIPVTPEPELDLRY
ncbi:unnamed protein product [Orchesella dallaii]|uniref:Purple acid phosphatase n=1 Tax=Orchesella dallaii TaxID=48710 RepID=A0ABP1QF64_9HEXA